MTCLLRRFWRQKSTAEQIFQFAAADVAQHTQRVTCNVRERDRYRINKRAVLLAPKKCVVHFGHQGHRGCRARNIA